MVQSDFCSGVIVEVSATGQGGLVDGAFPSLASGAALLVGTRGAGEAGRVGALPSDSPFRTTEASRLGSAAVGSFPNSACHPAPMPDATMTPKTIHTTGFGAKGFTAQYPVPLVQIGAEVDPPVGWRQKDPS